jgi:predicted DsbA family dithiol-disulfide isomerase
VLVACAADVGLDRSAALAMLHSAQYADTIKQEVRSLARA